MALANWPTFNPNVRKKLLKEMINQPAVSDVMMPVDLQDRDIAAALEEKFNHFPKKDLTAQKGSIVVNGLRFMTGNRRMLSVSDILAKSQ